MESNITVILISVWCVIFVCLSFLYFYILTNILFIICFAFVRSVYTNSILVFGIYNSNVM